MSFPPYASYKPSGVEWIGQVPGSWGVTPLFGELDETKRPNRDGENVKVLSLSYGRVIRRDVSTNEGLLPASFSTYQEIQPGDIILRLTDLQNDQRSLRVGLAHEVGVITSAYVSLKSGGRLLPSYAYYLLHAYDLTKVLYSLGGGVRQSLKFADLKRLPVLAPPTADQLAIVHFLDRRVAEIDALIARKRKLTGLLDEKRSAEISHAITQGINSKVAMTFSGIEWLGDIPSSWTVTRMRFLAEVRQGVPKGRDLGTQTTITVPYLRVANVQDGHLNLEDLAEIEILPAELERYSLRDRDILMNEGGDNDKLGRGAVWRNQVSPCIHQNHVFAVRPNDTNLASWISLVTQSAYAKFFFFSRAKQSTNLASISSSNLRDLPVILPPREVRLEIEKHISEACSEIDVLTASVDSAIERLREYRTALIDAAVTGKIDVRDYEPPELCQ
ncbi:MAG: type restriction enzyme subunit [Thermoanaerobaculia bacterium]|jgi:type I restriction enzyme S subunit|nr:type restriction enzyme subunit [Thermoanaerobaculia bacterium]